MIDRSAIEITPAERVSRDVVDTQPPPFDPPYKTVVRTSSGERWTETFADGTEVESVPPSIAVPISSNIAHKPSTVIQKNSGGVFFLEVPFSQKDDAKRLGARWDSTKRKWYVPQGADVKNFSRWILGDNENMK
jgi:hypothetical protein